MRRGAVRALEAMEESQGWSLWGVGPRDAYMMERIVEGTRDAPIEVKERVDALLRRARSGEAEYSARTRRMQEQMVRKVIEERSRDKRKMAGA